MNVCDPMEGCNINQKMSIDWKLLEWTWRKETKEISAGDSNGVTCLWCWATVLCGDCVALVCNKTTENRYTQKCIRILSLNTQEVQAYSTSNLPSYSTSEH